MSEFQTIIYEVERGRARIILNRPEKRNALSLQLLTELNEALWEADYDTNVHGVVLRGAGSAFCAGYDLSATSTASQGKYPSRTYRSFVSFDDDCWQMEWSQRLRMALFDMHKPVVAQVHGYCLAGGTDLALMCDIVIAAQDAVIGYPPTRDFGAPPSHLWLYHVGPQWAKRLLLTGDSLSGAEAAKIGLVLKAVQADMLEAEVEGLMDRFALIDPDLLAANKRIINLGLELMGARTLQRLAVENDARGHRSSAAQDFVRSVMEKGVKAAVTARDRKFGDGRARVDGPEIRDEEGQLVDE